MSDLSKLTDDVLNKTFQDVLTDRETLVNLDTSDKEARSQLAKLMECKEEQLTTPLEELKNDMLTAIESMLENFSKEINKRTLAKLGKN
jgi:hypothetical protein